jgi:hypothetical protein
MMWSKLKQLVEQGFAPSLGKRLAINSAAYGACGCGHAWLTLDKTVVANFCTRAYHIREYARHRGEPEPGPLNKMYESQFAAYGELSRQDAYRACWDFIHALSIEEALRDADPLVQTLAVADKRVGKRRLKLIDAGALHPLARRLLIERRRAEGLPVERIAA